MFMKKFILMLLFGFMAISVFSQSEQLIQIGENTFAALKGKSFPIKKVDDFLSLVSEEDYDFAEYKIFPLDKEDLIDIFEENQKVLDYLINRKYGLVVEYGAAFDIWVIRVSKDEFYFCTFPAYARKN